jgi:hypothetical protein
MTSPDYIVYLVKRDDNSIVREKLMGEWNVSRDVDTRSNTRLLDTINELIDCDDHDRAQLLHPQTILRDGTACIIDKALDNENAISGLDHDDRTKLAEEIIYNMLRLGWSAPTS